MKIKPEERSKVIMLAIATAIVLTYVIVTMVGRMSAGTTPPANTSTETTGAQANNTPPATAPVTGAPDPTSGTPNALSPGLGNNAVTNAVPGKIPDLNADLPAPATTRDPFTPILPTGTVTIEPQPIRPSQFGPKTVVTNYAVSGRNAAPFNPTPFNPNMGGGNRMGNGNVSPTPAAVPEPDTILAGVIAGPSAVAVLHIADRSYEVMQGERLPNDLALARVTDSGVYVTRGQKKWFIRIGKTLSTAMPIKLNGGPGRLPRTLRATMPFPTGGLAVSGRMGAAPRTVGNTLGQ